MAENFTSPAFVVFIENLHFLLLLAWLEFKLLTFVKSAEEEKEEEMWSLM